MNDSSYGYISGSCGRGTMPINIYHVIIPWRREVTYEDMGSGRSYPRSDRLNNKGDMRCHPKGQTDIKIPCQPARLCTETEASEWLTPGTLPWYFAQGLTPPAEKTENGNGNGC